MGVTSEHLWPKQPSKTLEKAPPERPEDISWWREPHTYTQRWYCWKDVPGTVLDAEDTAGNKIERVLPSWSNPSVGETDNKTRQIRNIRGVLQGDKYWGEN